MKIELEVNVFNVKDGKLSDTFPEEFSWQILDDYFESETMPGYGCLFYAPYQYVFWESADYPIIVDPHKWLKGKYLAKEIIDLFIDKKNWKQVKLSYSSELSLENTTATE